MWAVDAMSFTELQNSPHCLSSVSNTGVAQSSSFLIYVPFVGEPLLSKGRIFLWLEPYYESLKLSMLHNVTGRVRPE